MEIQGAAAKNSYYNPAVATEAQKAEETKKAAEAKRLEETKQQAEAVKKGDGFAKTGESASVTYEVPKKLNVDQKRMIEEQRTASFQNMLKDMVGKQARVGSMAGQDGNSAVSMATIIGFAGTSDPAKAAASIAPGGEYSVEAVATRIFDMAKSLAGGDESKISLLRDAVEKGFKAAGVELGGKLPSISTDTYNEVMKRFDDWENKKTGE